MDRGGPVQRPAKTLTTRPLTRGDKGTVEGPSPTPGPSSHCHPFLNRHTASATGSLRFCFCAFFGGYLCLSLESERIRICARLQCQWQDVHACINRLAGDRCGCVGLIIRIANLHVDCGPWNRFV